MITRSFTILIIIAIVTVFVGIIGKYIRKNPNKDVDNNYMKMPKFILFFGYAFFIFGFLLLLATLSLLFTDGDNAALIGLSATTVGSILFGLMFRHIYRSFYITFQKNYVEQRTAFLGHIKKIYYDSIIKVNFYKSNGHQYILIVDINNQKMTIDATFFDVHVLMEQIKDFETDA